MLYSYIIYIILYYLNIIIVQLRGCLFTCGLCAAGTVRRAPGTPPADDLNGDRSGHHCWLEPCRNVCQCLLLPHMVRHSLTQDRRHHTTSTGTKLSSVVALIDIFQSNWNLQMQYISTSILYIYIQWLYVWVPCEACIANLYTVRHLWHHPPINQSACNSLVHTCTKVRLYCNFFWNNVYNI